MELTDLINKKKNLNNQNKKDEEKENNKNKKEENIKEKENNENEEKKEEKFKYTNGEINEIDDNGTIIIKSFVKKKMKIIFFSIFYKIKKLFIWKLTQPI